VIYILAYSVNYCVFNSIFLIRSDICILANVSPPMALFCFTH